MLSLEDLLAADFTTPPYDHQLKEFAEFGDAPARAMAWHMRTGKSKVVIDRACYLYTTDKIDAVLVFAPNGVHVNWLARELPAHGWASVRTLPIVWQTSVASERAGNRLSKAIEKQWKQNRAIWWWGIKKTKQDPRLVWLSVNSESMTRPDVRRVVAYLLKHRRVFLVVDESDDFGTPGTKRTKMIRSLARKCPYRVILSGTMLTGNLLAAFSQYEILERAALGFKRADDFNQHFAIYEQGRGVGGRLYPKFVAYQRKKELRRRIAPYTSVVLRSDCHDMPKLRPTPIYLKPTIPQLEAYRRLHHDFLLDIEGGLVDVGERAPRFAKMQQVFSGFVFDAQKKVIWLPGENPRLEALMDELYMESGKAIVWCNFQPDMACVVQRLKKDGIEVYQYHGQISPEQKQKELDAFRATKARACLVGHCKSGGRGQDFSVADTMFWYSHTFSARFRAQAMERATKLGGRNVRVADLVAPGPDQYILSRTQSRIDDADEIGGEGLKQELQRMNAADFKTLIKGMAL